MRGRKALACLLAVGLLGGCGAGEDGLIIGDPGDDDNDGSGLLDLSITDAPVDDVSAVVLRITGIEMQHSDGERELIEFDPPRTLDLLALRGGVTEPLLNDREVPAGRYQWLRLQVDAPGGTDISSHVDTLTGGRFPLAVAADPGLMIIQDFIVSENGSLDLVVDVDLRKGLTHTTGDPDYLLRPSLRLVDAATAGRVRGAIRSSLITDIRCSSGPGDDIGNSVYAYSGHDVVPDDIDGDLGDPITSTEVVNPAFGVYQYTLSFLPPGAYTIAFTCQANSDDPAADDALLFTSTENVLVLEGRTSTQDL